MMIPRAIYSMDTCPCQSGLTYADCCQPIHLDPRQAKIPEQLMRARYSAHVLRLLDFVIDTYHPSCQAHLERDAIIDSINGEWLGLEVVRTWFANHDNEGFVHFKAFYAANQQKCCLEEQSRFVKEQQQWFYIDGTFPNQQKIGRNDPCICGSGKKYKKCCG